MTDAATSSPRRAAAPPAAPAATARPSGPASDVPPGPRSRLACTFRLARAPLHHLPRWLAAFGDPFRVPLLTGAVVVTADPTSLRTLFTADPDSFDLYSPRSLLPILGPGSLILRAGPEHRSERRLLMPPFHGARMRTYGAAMAAISGQQLADLAPGQPFLALALGQRISLDIIIRTVFGVDDDQRRHDFRHAVAAALAVAHPLLLFVPAFQRRLFGLGPFDRLLRAQDHLLALLRQQIAAVRPDAAARDDILSLLLAARHDDDSPMSEPDVLDELRTLLIAGHETTAIALAWALDHVHRDPAVLARLRGELDPLGPDPRPEALAGLAYLGAVCSETLRLHPVVPGVARRLRVPLELGGHRLPPGTSVLASIHLAHHREPTFSDPTRFHPDRFLGAAYSPYQYLPFGGGHRRCIGAAFAQHELKVVLGTILARADLELRDPRPVAAVRRNLTMGPATGIPLTLVRHRR